MSAATGIAASTLRLQIRSAVDTVISVERRSGIRRVTGIHAIGDETVDEVYRC